MIRAEKVPDGRVPLPARSGYISENRGTIILGGKSRRGRAYPAVFRTRQGESGCRPISCVLYLLCRSFTRVYPVVSFTLKKTLFDTIHAMKRSSIR